MLEPRSDTLSLFNSNLTNILVPNPSAMAVSSRAGRTSVSGKRFSVSRSRPPLRSNLAVLLLAALTLALLLTDLRALFSKTETVDPVKIDTAFGIVDPQYADLSYDGPLHDGDRRFASGFEKDGEGRKWSERDGRQPVKLPPPAAPVKVDAGAVRTGGGTSNYGGEREQIKVDKTTTLSLNPGNALRNAIANGDGSQESTAGKIQVIKSNGATKDRRPVTVESRASTQTGDDKNDGSSPQSPPQIRSDNPSQQLERFIFAKSSMESSMERNNRMDGQQDLVRETGANSGQIARENVMSGLADWTIPHQPIRSLSYHLTEVDLEEQFGLIPTNQTLVSEQTLRKLVYYDIRRDPYFKEMAERYNMTAVYDTFSPALGEDGRPSARYAAENSGEKLYHVRHTGDRRKGYGVYASKDIPKGKILGSYGGELMPESELADGQYAWEAPKMMLFNNITNSWRLEEMVLDAKRVGNMMRFMNDLGESKESIEIEWIPLYNRWALFYLTTRDVKKGEEMSVSYGEQYWVYRKEASQKGHEEIENGTDTEGVRFNRGGADTEISSNRWRKDTVKAVRSGNEESTGT